MSFTPFIDGQNSIGQSTNRASASIGYDTTSFDHLRQGVEIRNDKDRYGGPLKISAGTLDHSLEQIVFGQPLPYKEEFSFEEADRLTANMVLSGAMNLAQSEVDSNILDGFQLDGVLEPFTIREVATFSSIEAPFISHAIKSDLQGGNLDPVFGGSDVILQFEEIKPPLVERGFLDASDVFTSGSDGFMSLPSAFLSTETIIYPFNDINISSPDSILANIELIAQASGLTLWLDPIRSANTTVDGQAVSSYRDISQNQFTAFVSAGSDRPTYSSTGINGHPALLFTAASSQYLTSSGDSTLVFSSIGRRVIMAVVNVISISTDNSTTNANVSVFSDTSNVTGIYFKSTGPKAAAFVAGAGITDQHADANISLLKPALITMIWLDGVLSCQINDDTTVVADAPLDSVPPLILQLGHGGGGYFNGYVGDIVVLGSNHSNAEIFFIKEFLRQKYNLWGPLEQIENRIENDMIPLGYRSMNAGFTYENAKSGTDSLAFGGFKK